jgi:hypothetical protein
MLAPSSSPCKQTLDESEVDGHEARERPPGASDRRARALSVPGKHVLGSVLHLVEPWNLRMDDQLVEAGLGISVDGLGDRASGAGVDEVLRSVHNCP